MTCHSELASTDIGHKGGVAHRVGRLAAMMLTIDAGGRSDSKSLEQRIFDANCHGQSIAHLIE
jgi:hypothetical protein